MGRSGRSGCHIFLAFVLKFLNYLQAFVGVSIIISSCFMLDHWHHHPHDLPSPSSSPSLAPYPFYDLDSVIVAPNDVTPLNLDLDFAAEVVASDGLEFNIHSLPTPWFIYAFMGFGIALCCITCIGHIAAEAINGCCLCFYALSTTSFFLLEVSLVAFIAFDHQWEKDLPADSTGELDRLRAFIEEHTDILKGVGIAVIIIQALSFLLSIILRALVNQRVEPDNDDVYDTRGRPGEPLLHPHLSQASGSVRSDGRVSHSDIWSSRMRDKYGLNGGDGKQNLLNQSTIS